MDGEQDDLDRTGEDGSWSLLYAPPTTLQPIACHACGNVFAAESTACPWCGRIVGSSTRCDDTDEVELGSSASLLIPHTTPQHAVDAGRDGSAAEPAADTGSDGAAAPPWPEQSGAQQARRWAGVLVAAGVLLAIATGVTVRSRDADDRSIAAGPVTSSATSVTSAANATAPSSAASTTGAPASAPTAASTTASAPARTVAPTAPPATSAPATPAPATSAAATVAPRPTTTVEATATTESGPSLSAAERDAVDVTRGLNDAIVRKDWDTVRTLAPANPVSDETYERFWGGVQAATVVPARVAARPGGTFDVYVGVVSVLRADQGSGVTTSLVCGRYSVDAASGTVAAVATKALRTEQGEVDASSVATELRDACRDPAL